MAHSMSELLTRYGYVLLAVMLFIEAAGIPIPGETALVTAAALAGQGTLSFVGVLIAACIGTMGGTSTGYWLGARGGKPFLDRFGSTLRLDSARIEKANALFLRQGRRALIVGRFVPLLRSFVGVFSGISGMPRFDFVVFSAVGSVAWSGCFCVLGFVFGRNLPRVIRQLGRVSLLLALVIGVVISLVWASRWFRANGPAIVVAIDRRRARLLGSRRMVALSERYPRAWRIFASRLAQIEYLTVHLFFGWLISLGALGVFAAITEDVVEGAPLTLTDQALAGRLHAAASPQLLAILHVVTFTGGRVTIAAIAVLLGVLLMTQRRWLPLMAWTAAYLGSIGLDTTLRHIVQRGELPFARALEAERRSSLPTGHTIGAIVGYGFLMYVLRRTVRSDVSRGILLAAAITLVAGIVLGRLVLGLGYLSTESASVACGVLWLASCISGSELAIQQRRAAGVQDE